MRRVRKPSVFAASAVAAACLWARPADAEDLVVPADATDQDELSGDLLYERVTISGTLSVKTYNSADTSGPTGWLRLRAQEITIESTGVIDATGKGYRGAKEGAEGYESGAGLSPPLTTPPEPGGGGAHTGAGGPGLTISTCALFPDAGGGQAYDDAADDPLGLDTAERIGGMGSAGGTGWGPSATNPYDGPGGGGGGMVILEAATVMLDGTIVVDGKPGLVSESTGYGVLGAAAGGGAGGSVIILSNNFSFGTTAAITARGGVGAIDSADENVVGGSGGGGRVTLRVGTQHQSFVSQIDVDGGAAASSCAGSAGQPGLIEIVDAPACIDADRDDHGSEACGGDDCNDGNPNINPGLPELCNRVPDPSIDGGIDAGYLTPDENCDGEPNAAADGGVICAEGANYICDDGECIPDPNAEPEPPPQNPQYVRIGGGFCSSRPSPASLGGGAALLLLALCVGGAVSRRIQRVLRRSNRD